MQDKVAWTRVQVFDIGVDLEGRSFIIQFLRFGDTDASMDTGMGIRIKIIQISESIVIKPKS